jgi:hypothetical protein
MSPFRPLVVGGAGGGCETKLTFTSPRVSDQIAGAARSLPLENYGRALSFFPRCSVRMWSSKGQELTAGARRSGVGLFKRIILNVGVRP